MKRLVFVASVCGAGTDTGLTGGHPIADCVICSKCAHKKRN